MPPPDEEMQGGAPSDGLAEMFTGELEAPLTRLLEVGRDLAGGGYAALGILDPPRMRLKHFITVGLDGGTREAIGAHPRGRGVLGILMTDPRGLRLDDVADDPRRYGFPANHPVMRSFVGAPILIDCEPWGNLYLADKSGGAFDEVDEQGAIDLAAAAARAVKEARSRTPAKPEA